MTADSRRAPDEAIIGAVIGHYRIVELVNQGGMGAVYRAEHTLMGKVAAIKLLLPDLSQNEEMVHRFFNEAKAASGIRHPGIVEIFDFGYHDDGRAYIVMEFLEGESLGERLDARGRVPELEAAILTRAIAGALAAAHAKGIVHRDLKPDNVYLVKDADMPTGERTKVLDFGIAKLADAGGGPGGARTRTGVLMGTPLYMAPEQARGAGEVDARADLYALGCMLYEMLVGAPPFVAEGAGEIIALQLFGEVEPPRARVPALSAPIEAIALRLLEKEPDARYQSAAELVDALARLLPSLSARLSAATAAPGPSKMRKIVATPRPDAHGRPTAEAVLPSLPPGASHSQVAAAARPRPTAGVHTTLGQAAAQSIPPVAPAVARRRGLWIAMAGALAIGAAIGMFVIVRSLAGTRAAGGSAAVNAGSGAATPAVRPPVPASPVDAAPASIAVTLALDPPTATVTVDGQPAARRGDVIAIPRDGAAHVIRAAAPGFVAGAITVQGDRDQPAALALVAAPRAPVAAEPSGRDHPVDHHHPVAPSGPTTHPDDPNPRSAPITTSPNGSPIEPSL
jgi:serine/threonine-protein kinase